MDLITKQTVLVVDDTPENIDVMTGILGEEYRVKVALNGEKALELANADPPPDIILLDIMMPGMDGYEVCQQLKKDQATKRIPIIFVTAMDEVKDEAKGFELGAVDYITKPVSPPIVLARVQTQLALYDQNRTLEKKVRRRTAELNDTRLEIIRRLGRAAEYRDNETGNHVIRMSHYSQLIGLEAGLSDEQAELLLNAAPMHDVGKIGIPDSILLKPDKLDDAEWETMQQHTTFGAEIIGNHSSEILDQARMIAQTHHEKWDGTGYPRGLKGKDISLMCRIVPIADVFDALTSERPYKKAWTPEKAVEVIQKDAGTHFDPTLVEAFMDVLPEVLKIKKQYAD